MGVGVNDLLEGSVRVPGPPASEAGNSLTIDSLIECMTAINILDMACRIRTLCTKILSAER
jgi:hypothetical protein